MKKLSELILAGPDEGFTNDEEVESTGDKNEQGREDQLQAFADFTNEDLPSDERADALAFFVELVHASGPTILDDE